MLFGFVASKFWALAVGPMGMGRASVLQSTVTLVGTVVGLGLGSAVVKLGTKLAAQPQDPSFRSMLTAAWSLWRWSSIVGGIAILVALTAYRAVLQEPLSPSINDLILIWSLLATTATALLQSVIGASRQVHLQATYMAFGAMAGHLLSVPLVWWLGTSAIGIAIALNYSGQLLVSILTYRVVATQHQSRPKPDAFRSSRATLLQTGLPLALSNLVGGGVQSVLPLLVIYKVGDDAAGLLRAASLLAFQSVGFLMTALSQDYFPRISAVRQDKLAVQAILNKQFSIMLALAVAVTCALTATGPWLLRLCFSEEFVKATTLLDLLAIGTVFKMGSWCLAYVVLARCSSRTYLVTEAVTGLLWLGSAVVLTSLYGENGIGYAFVLTYVTYFILVAAIVSRDLKSTIPWKMFLGSAISIMPLLAIVILRSKIGVAL